jgi:hypothetical protein
MILLLPQPFGPITPVIPSSKCRVVLSAKLLNPLISKLFKRTVSLVFGQAANLPKKPFLGAAVEKL